MCARDMLGIEIHEGDNVLVDEFICLTVVVVKTDPLSQRLTVEVAATGYTYVVNQDEVIVYR